MKLISLNTWGGRVHKALLEFFKDNQDIDIFCLQEIYHNAPKPLVEDLGDRLNLLSEIVPLLPSHNLYFKPHVFDHFGLAIFINKNIKVIKEGDIFVFKERKDRLNDFNVNHARNLQFLDIETDNGIKTILNFHGLWNGKSKEDTEERMTQASNIAKYIRTISNPCILCGDFNLLPENKSLKIIEDTGMKNLIKEYKITSTRSSHYKKPVKFADYALVSNNIKINEFKVLQDEVSDHLAMYIDFD